MTNSVIILTFAVGGYFSVTIPSFSYEFDDG